MIRNHPVVGTYWALDAAAEVAEEKLRDPGSRERFVKLVRESLAYATERGVPWPVARKRTPETRAADAAAPSDRAR